MATNSEHARLVATEGGHRVTPAELYFDLVFVYAITQVTALMAADPRRCWGMPGRAPYTPREGVMLV
ncbi:low temperature requirement protein A [Streptomyces sp. NBC_00444]|uniref:low temperature requirement protein A n=1 Tax=Streptomyces sp. NBC_00444 TaxID=2975744 RepID=UPI002E2116BD